VLKRENGATIIMLDNWTYPLIVVKSDGGYTYDTTDLAALYHRLCVINIDHVIYVTDSGQKSHFEMCFEIARIMGWLNPNQLTDENKSKKLTHIGFGLVLGKDGTKLKTRSGDVVKMLDVISEVINLSRSTIDDRAKKCRDISDTLDDPTTAYYRNITDEKMDIMSKRIGINTLKYFDLCHNFETNYKYDPNLMFRFAGDTGVYLMYCFARINGIIERSNVAKSLNINRKNNDSIINLLNHLASIKNITPIDFFTKETRDLLIHIINFDTYLERATVNLDSTELTKYIYLLCTCFNTYVTQKNGKIIGSETEEYGIAICVIVSKIIEYVFDLLSFEPVEHI
jgi:arginyl-tRNA synthetase